MHPMQAALWHMLLAATKQQRACAHGGGSMRHVQSFTRSPTHPPTYPPTHSLTHSLVCRLFDQRRCNGFQSANNAEHDRVLEQKVWVCSRVRQGHWYHTLRGVGHSAEHADQGCPQGPARKAQLDWQPTRKGLLVSPIQSGPFEQEDLL